MKDIIEEALDKYYPNRYKNGTPESVTSYNEGYDDGYEAGFRKAANLFISKTLWKKYPEELPEHEASYFVYTISCTCIVLTFVNGMWATEDGRLYDSKRVLAFTELPESPVF